MKRKSIILLENKRSPRSYRYLERPEAITERGILNKIVEWSQNQNKDISIYDHILRIEEVNFDLYADDPYIVPANGDKVPYCDCLYILDIWYQEKG